MSVFPQLCNGGHCSTFEILGSLFKILSLSAFFPFQTENIQVMLPPEGRLEGKVGFKTYENYYTAGTHWFIIIFLILVNVTAQVNKDIYFDLCLQLDIYTILLFLICILQDLCQRTGS